MLSLLVKICSSVVLRIIPRSHAGQGNGDFSENGQVEIFPPKNGDQYRNVFV